ncbi:MAG: glycoside hydrolase family 3 protein, partial [Candidatus Kapaibacterium sp.]
MPRLEITRYEQDPQYRSYVSSLIGRRMVGGFCIFGGTIESLPIILSELQELAKQSGLPDLLMSCDCEWGLPMRLQSGGTEFPHLMALEQMGDQNGIRQVGQAIGTEMSALGLHWNFAPVADINSNPKNPIINIRAFSGDPETVAECAQSFFEGLQAAGIIATAKHFPGHGDTHIDSHRDLPSIEKTAEEFEEIELFPFRQLIAGRIPSIMTGHIAAPKLAQSLGADNGERNLPATISPFLTKKLLREKIGFKGVIIT